MINLVKQIILYYFKNNKKPDVLDLNIEDKSLLEKKWTLFVTFYKSWEIRGSAWNIKEIKNNIVEELIENTIEALNDKRFEKIKASEIKDLKIRIDILDNKKRTILKNNSELKELNPVKFWVIAIKKDYSKLAIILPNIDSKLFSWKDLEKTLAKKLEENFEFKNYIVYKIETDVITDF